MSSKRRARALNINRQQLVEAPSHPDCEACDALRVKVDQQVIAGGVLRLTIIELKQKIRQLTGDRYTF